MFPLGDVPIWAVEALTAAGHTVQTTCVPGDKENSRGDKGDNAGERGGTENDGD